MITLTLTDWKYLASQSVETVRQVRPRYNQMDFPVYISRPLVFIQYQEGSS